MVSRQFWCLVGSLLCAAGMWLYAQRVLVPFQMGDARAHGRPRGNLSDLYPRWVGARELLLHNRDPYSAEVTREIQAGYYGRPLDPLDPRDPKDQQGFAYPVFVVFYLAPTVRLGFAVIQKAFFWLLIAATLTSIPLWLRVLRWRVPLATQVGMMAMTMGSLAVMQGLKLQQLSLLVAASIAVAIALLAADHAIAAGIVLALATVKPQLVWPLLVWLAIWTVADWRRRYRWAVSFLISMAVLVAGSEWLLPHWISRFWQSVHEYRNYTDAVSVFHKLLPPPWGTLLEWLAGAVTVFLCWQARRQDQRTGSFALTTSLVLAATVLIVPGYAPYNQVLLIPAVLLLLRDRVTIWRASPVSRVLLVIAAMQVGWPWFSAVILAGLSFLLPPAIVVCGWSAPFWTALLIPSGVAALMLVHTYRTMFAASAASSPAS